MSARASDDGVPAGPRSFRTTHWSVVLAAGDAGSSRSAEALESLCRTYWPPLYAFVRRAGYDSEDAQDLVQGFFASLLEHRVFGVADPGRGRFRSFLLVRLKHFLSDERKRARARKRGGGQPVFSLDAEVGEEGYSLEPCTEETPELFFDRRWALTVMGQAFARLREEYVASDRGQLFDELKRFQPGQDDGRSYAEVADRLGVTVGAVKSAIHRLRQRHRDLLREEIAHTVAAPAEIDEELRYLVSILKT